MILVYLELAKMPEDCDYCPLNYDDMYCTAVKLPKGSGIRYDNVRPDWCPLREVTPHEDITLPVHDILEAITDD